MSRNQEGDLHHVSRIQEAEAQTPELYQKHTSGFRRVPYVDHSTGSVHMGVGVCFLAPGGLIHPHVHAFEESFYVLEGSVVAQIGEKSYALGPGHFGLIRTGVPHAFRNAANGDRKSVV